MEFSAFGIGGPLEILPRKISDSRGYFSEVFRADLFAEHTAPVEFVQENQSLSVQTGTIRGIHFQTAPAAQGKLVRCLAGKVFDVAVDLRTDQPTYGHWISTVLTPDASNQMWVPAGFGHAFCTLESNSIIAYKVTSYHNAQCEKGVAWDDPDIGIAWPDVAAADTLSEKDRKQPRLADLPSYFPTES